MPQGPIISKRNYLIRIGTVVSVLYAKRKHPFREQANAISSKKGHKTNKTNM